MIYALNLSNELFKTLSDLQSYIILTLGALFVLFFALAIVLLATLKRPRNKAHIVLLCVSLLFLLLLIGIGLAIAPVLRAALSLSLLEKLAIEYQNLWVNIFHIAAIVPVLLCTALLLFPPKKGKQVRPHTKNFERYFSTYIDGESEQEIVGVRNIFLELGATEADIKDYIERQLKKITERGDCTKKDEFLTRVDEALSKLTKA